MKRRISQALAMRSTHRWLARRPGAPRKVGAGETAHRPRRRVRFVGREPCGQFVQCLACLIACRSGKIIGRRQCGKVARQSPQGFFIDRGCADRGDQRAIAGAAVEQFAKTAVLRSTGGDVQHFGAAFGGTHLIRQGPQARVSIFACRQQIDAIAQCRAAQHLDGAPQPHACRLVFGGQGGDEGQPFDKFNHVNYSTLL